MEKLESRILELLRQESSISRMVKVLDIKEENLADSIIDLEIQGFITLESKKWKLTEKGNEIFEKRDNLLKKLKIEYLYGKINNREEYNKRKKDLEDISYIISISENIIESETSIESEQLGQEGTDIKPEEKSELIQEEMVIKPEEKKEILICSKCGTENRQEYNYCRKCGNPLK